LEFFLLQIIPEKKIANWKREKAKLGPFGTCGYDMMYWTIAETG
jgi:hypothetical protein